MFEKLKKYFTPAESITADEARDYMNSHAEGTFTLLDVRQHSEYEKAHIPGAKLMPITQLSDSIDRLDPEEPVIAY
ncbi:MAG: rhodanese-like domain-containing protein [Desulfomonile tiedjei]|uniref:Rhodanese-like domain-containing protein n=1 Tax=Desulfomonile tiedjei TaxID=2358 RepID=A0A9D6Z8V8_9BACT|nr:rhodanese-like domain-containing protein [Desulfomonile tiedjei]